LLKECKKLANVQTKDLHIYTYLCHTFQLHTGEQYQNNCEADVAYSKHLYSIAADKYTDFLERSKELLHDSVVANINQKLSVCFRSTGEIKLAERSIKKSIGFREASKNKVRLRECRLELAKIYLMSNNFRQLELLLTRLKETLHDQADKQFERHLALLDLEYHKEAFQFLSIGQIENLVNLLKHCKDTALVQKYNLLNIQQKTSAWEFNEAKMLLTKFLNISSNDPELIFNGYCARLDLLFEQKSYSSIPDLLKEFAAFSKGTENSFYINRMRFYETQYFALNDKFSSALDLADQLAKDNLKLNDTISYLKSKLLYLYELSRLGAYNKITAELPELQRLAKKANYQYACWKLKERQALTYKQLGRKMEALDLLETLRHDYNNKEIAQLVIQNMAYEVEILLGIGNYEKSALLIDSIGIFAKSGYHQYIYNLELGTLNYHQKNYKTAKDRFNENLALTIQLGYDHGTATTMNNLGFLYALLDEENQYLKLVDSTIQFFEKTGNLSVLSQVWYGLGRYYKNHKDFDKSNACWNKSIDIKELIRKNAASEERKIYMEKEMGLYNLLQQNYYLTNKLEACYQVGEVSKSKWLEEKINNEDHDMAVPELDSIIQSIPPEMALISYVNHLYLRLAWLTITSDSISGARERNSTLYAEALKITEFVKFLELRTDSISFSEIMSKKYLRNKKLSRIILESIAAFYRTLLQKPLPNEKQLEQFRECSHLLYNFLIKPLESVIQGKKELVIVPDAILGYIPFETLLDENGNYLIESFDIKYVQSATIWHYLRNLPEHSYEQQMLAFGNPAYRQNIENDSDINALKNIGINVSDDSIRTFLNQLSWSLLPGSKNELKLIESIYPEGTYIEGKKVTENRVKKMSQNDDLKRYEIIHFSTHGIFVPQHPELSAIVLPADKKEDGFLSVPEISEMNLNARMVNLSACETGLGDAYSGEGIVGLAQSFIVAGANALTVSLWQVPDQSTADFMARFYHEIKNEQMTYAEALNKTKRDYIHNQKNPILASPYFWAPFIYYGK
jgi:CHAT domain-containing protein